LIKILTKPPVLLRDFSHQYLPPPILSHPKNTTTRFRMI
jgi:hypothetical protein